MATQAISENGLKVLNYVIENPGKTSQEIADALGFEKKASVDGVVTAGLIRNRNLVERVVAGIGTNEKGKPVEGVYVDRNGDGQISESDLYFYKQGDAPWMVGLSTRVEYKNWDLGLSFHSHLGNYVYNGNEMGKMNIEKRYDSSFGYLQNATAAGIERNFNTYENHLSDYWITNASFLKLDNITLGYSFSNLFKTGKYQGIGGRAYVVASNVMTITNYKGIDPEQNNGFENSLYPRPFNL